MVPVKAIQWVERAHCEQWLPRTEDRESSRDKVISLCGICHKFGQRSGSKVVGWRWPKKWPELLFYAVSENKQSQARAQWHLNYLVASQELLGPASLQSSSLPMPSSQKVAVFSSSWGATRDQLQIQQDTPVDGKKALCEALPSSYWWWWPVCVKASEEVPQPEKTKLFP
jgi:hypothetical protein